MVPTANGMILLLGILCIVLGIYIVPDADICAGTLCTIVGLSAVTFAVYGKYVLETPFAKTPVCTPAKTPVGTTEGKEILKQE
jgi:hypothetical protein